MLPVRRSDSAARRTDACRFGDALVNVGSAPVVRSRVAVSCSGSGLGGDRPCLVRGEGPSALGLLCLVALQTSTAVGNCV